jgi:hypothetical protein
MTIYAVTYLKLGFTERNPFAWDNFSANGGLSCIKAERFSHHGKFVLRCQLAAT